MGNVWEYVPHGFPHSSKSMLPYHAAKHSTNPAEYTMLIWDHDNRSLRNRCLPGSTTTQALRRASTAAVSRSGAAVAFVLLRLQLGQDKQRFTSASGTWHAGSQG